jgi:membrane-bound lytic murein transglycosylase D
MMKKLLLLMGLCIVPLIGTADEVSTDLMILNNSNSQQFNDIWSRMRAGFKLDHTQSDRVKYYERLYTKNPKNFNRLMNNAIPYLYFLLNEIERNGLPAELALIPGIESSYDPLAKNPTDAYAGMWQFVPSTGRRFNMAQNSSIDERRDIVKSTRSALYYLNYLHLMFGQWDVAIGAYNWGEGGMYRAILNSGMPLGNVTYSDLQLRQITADYVPKIIALASIIENPRKFGVTLDNVPNEPYFAIVTPASNTSVSDVSRLSSVDNGVFTKLNAEYKDQSYPLSAKNNILLPQPNQNIYYANVGQAVVLANGIQLANNNPTSSGDENIKPAALITVTPIESATESGVSNSAQNNQELDDLLAKIDPNNQNSTAGQTTEASDNDASAVTATTVALVTQTSVVKYTVNQGDTLYSISKKFNADINKIRSDNHIPGNNLTTGQVLNIQSNSAPSSSTM